MTDSNSKMGKQGGGMGMRGVTRPMAEKNMRDHDQKMHEGNDSDKDHDMKMDPEMREKMLHMHHMQTLWIYWMIVILGLWVLVSPFTFDYGIGTVQPSGGRSVWLTLEQRIAFMKWSDIISGALLIFFGWRGLTPNRPVSLWICCFVGIWLTMAPILFWSPSAVAYLNDTLVGALIIALTILIPGMPNMIMYMKMGPKVPPGWSYNPSSWPQRWIMMVLGFLGWIVSRYLAAFQLGYIDSVWDPFFGNQSQQVLNSNMSHSLPISDAGLGAIAYTFEFLMGWMGSPARWRTMPWMVAVFGILVIPLGLVHILLVISQPVMVGAWCTFCLLAAAIMLPMIPLEVDEVIAMGQFMKKKVNQGESFWKVFWKGGTVEGGEKEEHAPELMKFPQEPGKVYAASIWGMSFPWTLSLATIVGVAMVFAPGVFEVPIKDTVADVFHLAGSLVVVVSVICMGEPLRIGRYLNVLLGLAVAVAPWFFGGPTELHITGVVLGLAVAALAFPLGPVKQRFAGWDAYIR
ncbi:vitamin K epoxide reductase family protein [Pontibacter cellulosilyticus]|uniref:Vitamin K epoxide reductase family protein n=1 Tax=Pontibacter cellulosilyticus TaxID=1720253 RepID=A0A923N8Y3_9BACT|nr:vitamin K epoxide reductase family protein [Pontibacter cellulosilyticus]MBC5995085.1 vitamin K epoxide reductase family protein [Pontibacter cellulosilyticus]